MLYIEDGDTLKFLPGIPRAWLKDGYVIELDQVATYFGKASLRVESRLKERSIHATVRCDSRHAPRRVHIRIPHPSGQHPVAVTGGTYSEATETIRIESFTGAADLRVSY